MGGPRLFTHIDSYNRLHCTVTHSGYNRAADMHSYQVTQIAWFLVEPSPILNILYMFLQNMESGLSIG